MKVDEFGFYQLEADETQGGGDDVSSCGGTDAVAVESSVGSEVQFVSEQQCSEAGEAGKAAVEAGVEAGVKAGVKAGVAGVKAGVEAAAGSGNGKPPSVTSSPPPFMKKGQQKARALLNRALRKKPAAAKKTAAAQPAPPADPAEGSVAKDDTGAAAEVPGPSGSAHGSTSRKRPRSLCGEGGNGAAKTSSAKVATYSHEASRCQYQCRFGSGPGSTKGFSYTKGDDNSQKAAEQAASDWCSARNDV